MFVYIVHNVWVVYLLAGLASVRLLSAVSPLVTLHVVLLDEPHVTLITTEWLLSWTSGEIENNGQINAENPSVEPKDFQPGLQSTVFSQRGLLSR